MLAGVRDLQLYFGALAGVWGGSFEKFRLNLGIQSSNSTLIYLAGDGKHLLLSRKLDTRSGLFFR